MRPAVKIAAMAGLASAVLTAAGCHPRPETAASAGRLNCPAQTGELVLAEQSADGARCRYESAQGVKVDLRLTPVAGSAQATLSALEAELSDIAPELDAPNSGAPNSGASESWGGDEPATATPDAAELARRIEAQARADARGDSSAQAPAASSAGERVSVALPGLRIDATDEAANIRVGPVHIDASDDGATVRFYREVRLKGEALSRERRGLRAIYIVTGGREPSGEAFVGYMAAGPKAGPLTVALVSSPVPHENAGVVEDIEDLVRSNGGV